jgi:hypothetical protein
MGARTGACPLTGRRRRNSVRPKKPTAIEIGSASAPNRSIRYPTGVEPTIDPAA